MNRERDFFAAVVLTGLALTGCSCPTEPADAGTDVEIADAADVLDATDATTEGDMSTEDAGEDAMVLIL